MSDRPPSSFAVPPVQGTLALDLPAGTAAPPTPRLRVVPEEQATAPPAEVWARQFLRAMIEVIAGDRPVHQLVRWTDEAVYADLERRVLLLAQTWGGAGRGARSIPRPQLRTVHVSRPAPRVAEVAAHVRQGGRSRAIAARFEARHGRWLCTAAQFG